MNYYDEDKKFRTRILIMVVLTVIGAILLFLGIVLVNKDLDKKIVVGNSDLFVVHSKTTFGDVVANFTNYSSLDKAYSYKFYVENGENIDINYKVVLHRNDSSDISRVQYLVLQDGKEVFKGTLENKEDNILLSTKIMGNSLSNYEIKFWSNDALSKLNFRINVDTEDA